MKNKNKNENIYQKLPSYTGEFRFLIAVLAVVGFFLSAATFPIEAAPSDLDPTFGNGGIVTTDFNLSSEQVQAIAVQSDGKIVAAGRISNPQTFISDFALARYNTNGTLDVSFGTGGRVTTDIGFRQDTAYEVLIQADGKIVAAGTSGEDSQQNGYGFALARYNTDGSLDTSFGTGGKVRTRFNLYAYGFAAALQPDGKILVAGDSGNFGTSYFALARYNTNGTLDTSFGTGGLVTTDVSNSEEQAYAVALQADAKIVVAGFAVNGASRDDFALVRYNANGTLDTSFGASGKVITDFNGRGERAEDVAIQSDGKIIAVGPSNASETYSFALARYNSDGSLDTSFGAGGKVVNPTTESFFANAVAIQSNGKIIVAGRVGFPDMKFALTRYNTNGSFDTTFGTDGTVTTNISIGYEEAYALAIQSDGKIIAAGYGGNPQNNTSDFALVRYLGDSAAPRSALFDFDGDGKADVSVFRPENGTWYLNQSASGFAGVQFGINTDKIVPADYDGDGKTDVAVFRNGIWYLQRSQSGFTGVSFGETGDIPVPADYDGDGKADVAVFRPSNGVWYLQRSSLGFTGIQFGQTGDKPVAADYDGDGKADVAVYRNGTWYLQRSSLGFTGVTFGESTDKPVPADYDGDSKADIAVFRPSNGVWYLQRSTAGFAGIAFGFGTDLPVPADYDGDGKTDVAVFRNGTWYLQRSQAGFTGVAFGSSNDKPVPNAFMP